MGQHDPLLKDALMTIIERHDFIKPIHDKTAPIPGKGNADMPDQAENDPAIVSDLIKSSQASIEELKQNIQTKSGSDLFRFILEDIQELKNILFNPKSSVLIRTAMDASSWINEKMNEWLGEKTQQIRFLNLYLIILLQKWGLRYWTSPM